MTLLAGIPSTKQMIAAINSLHNSVTALDNTQYVVAEEDLARTNTNDVRTNDTELVLPLSANSLYVLDLILFTGPLNSTNNGITFEIAGSGMTGRWGFVSELFGDSRDINSGYGINDHNSSAPICIFGATLRTTTAGNVALKWGTNSLPSPNPEDPTTRLADSWMRVVKQ